MNVVTIDWDYFFPNIDAFDWGHSEHNAFFYEIIWSTRPNNRSLSGSNVGQRAIDVVHIHQKRLDYIKGLIEEWNPFLIYVAESHKLAYDVCSQLDLRKIDLWNLDAHHDTGYKGSTKSASCENWVTCLRQEKRLKSYNLIYPEWRKDAPEGKPKIKTAIQYDLPKIPSPQALFICRSPAWTPSWADHEWIAFLKLIQEKTTFQVLQDLIWRERQPTLEQAKQLADQMDEFLQKLVRREHVQA